MVFKIWFFASGFCLVFLVSEWTRVFGAGKADACSKNITSRGKPPISGGFETRPIHWDEPPSTGNEGLTSLHADAGARQTLLLITLFGDFHAY